MKSKVNALPVLNRISESVRMDITGLITEHVSSEFGFERFKQLWNLHRFSCIHHACPEKLHYGVFLQILFDSALSLCNVILDGGADFDYKQLAWNCSVVFSLFCLHQTQLHGDRPLLPIFVTVNQLSVLQRSVSASFNREAQLILLQMFQDNAFALSTYSGPQCLFYAEKWKINEVDSNRLLSYSKNVVVVAPNDTPTNVEGNDESDVVAKLEELIPARRAHKRLVAEAVVEKRRSRQAAAAQKLSNTLSKMSQPKPTRSRSSRIVPEVESGTATAAASSTSASKKASAKDKHKIKADVKLAKNVPYDSKGFDEVNKTIGGTSSRRRGSKGRTEKEGEEGAAEAGRSLVDDLEDMIRLSGQPTPPPPPRKRKQPAAKKAAVGPPSTDGAAVVSTIETSPGSSVGRGGKAKARKITGKSGTANNRRSKENDTAGRGSVSAIRNNVKSSSGKVDSKKRAKSGSASGESVLQLLEELERATADTLTGSKRRRNRSKPNTASTSRTSTAEGAVRLNAAEESMSVLAMVEQLERDSAAALAGENRRARGAGGAKRKQQQPQTKEREEIGSAPSKRRKTVVVGRGGTLPETIPTNSGSNVGATVPMSLKTIVAGVAESASVLSMLQELEQDSNNVLSKNTVNNESLKTSSRSKSRL